MNAAATTEFVARQFGDLLESTPEGVYRMDRLRRDADAGMLALAADLDLGLIEVDELRRALDAKLDAAIIGVPSDGVGTVPLA